jgi:hypothetical protein
MIKKVRMLCGEDQGSFWGSSSVLLFDLGMGYMGVFIL